MLASVVIRTYNEEKHLNELLTSLFRQVCVFVDIEIVVVDSGSTDGTLNIARKHGCRIVCISKTEFTFGRSLNIGCENSKGAFLVFISGHCIPTNESWLDELLKPLIDGTVSYVYGKQEGRDTTKFSESRHLEKCFPHYAKLPQDGFFCNNANAALMRRAWERYGFHEELTGLEDMYLAKQLIEAGEHIGYTPSASVYHIHDETWQQVRMRYEREAFALQRILPEVHFTLVDFFRYYLSSTLSDLFVALCERVLVKKATEILLFRLMHYWGTYRGNQEHRKLSEARKMRYFYPKDLEKDVYEQKQDCRLAATESK